MSDNSIQKLLNTDLGAISADGQRRSRNTRNGIIAALVVLAVIILIVLVTSGKPEPIIGRWNASTIVDSGSRVLKVPRGEGYIEVYKNGTLEIKLSGAEVITGKWKSSSETTSSGDRIYTTEFDDLSGVMSYNAESQLLNVMIGDIMISFEN